jgi:hypothetical protein
MNGNKKETAGRKEGRRNGRQEKGVRRCVCETENGREGKNGRFSFLRFFSPFTFLVTPTPHPKKNLSKICATTHLVNEVLHKQRLFIPVLCHLEMSERKTGSEQKAVK